MSVCRLSSHIGLTRAFNWRDDLRRARGAIRSMSTGGGQSGACRVTALPKTAFIVPIVLCSSNDRAFPQAARSRVSLADRNAHRWSPASGTRVSRSALDRDDPEVDRPGHDVAHGYTSAGTSYRVASTARYATAGSGRFGHAFPRRHPPATTIGAS
jgi:hypothetical protein